MDAFDWKRRRSSPGGAWMGASAGACAACRGCGRHSSTVAFRTSVESTQTPSPPSSLATQRSVTLPELGWYPFKHRRNTKLPSLRPSVAFST